MADFIILMTTVLTIIKTSDAGVHSIYSCGVLGINTDSTDILPNIEYSSTLSSPQVLPRSVSTSDLFLTTENSKNGISTSPPNPLNASSLCSISTSTPIPHSKSATLSLPSSIHTFDASSTTPIPPSSSTLVSTSSKRLPSSRSSSTTSPQHASRHLSSSALTSIKTPTTSSTPLHIPKFNLTPDQSTVYNLSDILKLLPAGFPFPSSLSSSVLSTNSFSSPKPESASSSSITNDNFNSVLLKILSKLSEVSDSE